MFDRGVDNPPINAGHRPPRSSHKTGTRSCFGRLGLAAVAAVLMLFAAPAFAQEAHQHGTVAQADDAGTTAAPADDAAAATPDGDGASKASPTVSYHTPTTFTLRTGISGGRMVYIGVGGDIDGKVNPTLMVHEGELIQINLINGEGAEHDIVIDQYAARSSIVIGKNASSTFSFTAGKVGEFAYFCSIAGHRQAGMEGLIKVMAGPREAMESEAPTSCTTPPTCPGRSASACRRWSRSKWKRWN